MLSRSSSPDVPLINLKMPRLPTAILTKLGGASEWSPDGKQDNREYNQPKITPFTSSASAFPPADRLRPVLTSLDPSVAPKPKHAAKRPPQFSSAHSSCSPSPSPKAKAKANARHGRPPLRGCGGKQPAVNGRGRGRGRGRGSKRLASSSASAGCMDQSLSSTSTNSTDVEESVTSPDDGTEPHKQITRESSASTDHGSCCSSPVSCVGETPSMPAPTLSSPGHVTHVTPPQGSVTPDPTTLVSQLNLTNGHPQQQLLLLPSSTVPSLDIDPLSTAFESHSHPYLNRLSLGLEDPGSGIRFLGEIEQVIDGHFLESLTHGLYGSSTTSSCLDSDLMPM
jgi:hypothetical protein